MSLATTRISTYCIHSLTEISWKKFHYLKCLFVVNIYSVVKKWWFYWVCHKRNILFFIIVSIILFALLITSNFGSPFVSNRFPCMLIKLRFLNKWISPNSEKIIRYLGRSPCRLTLLFQLPVNLLQNNSFLIPNYTSHKLTT